MGLPKRREHFRSSVALRQPWMSLFVVEVNPHFRYNPTALEEAAGQVVCWQYPDLYRRLSILHRSCALSLRAVGSLYLFVSAAGPFPCCVSGTSAVIYVPSSTLLESVTINDI